MPGNKSAGISVTMYRRLKWTEKRSVSFEDDRWITKILIAAILAVGWVFYWVGRPLLLALLLAGYQVEITGG